MRIAAFALALFLLLAAPLSAQIVEFNRDIRPILSDKCFTCHGPDKARRLTKLRFDIEADAKQDLGGRFAIFPGDAAKSEMIRRITAADPARRMPPVASGRTLTDREIQLIQRWIEQGAKWENHWSFIAPRARALPDSETRHGREMRLISSFWIGSSRRATSPLRKPTAPRSSVA